MSDDRCEKCGISYTIGDWPFCPHGRAASSVIGDEIDEVIEHFSGKPERFRSRARKAQRMRELGLTYFVRHVGDRGSDKSKKTQRWI